MTNDELIELVRRLKPMGVSEIHVNSVGNFTIKLDPSYQPRAKRQKRAKVDHQIPIDALNPRAWSPLTYPQTKVDPLSGDMTQEEFDKTLFYST